MKYVAAIDVGGTFIKASLVDENLNILTSTSRPTPSLDSTAEKTISAIKDLISEFEISYPVEAVGVSTPGSIDEINGVVRWAGNLNWKNIAFKELATKHLNKPVAFGHDVRAGGYAELKMGAGKDVKNSIFIPIGTGIAASLVVDGEIRTGDGYAGEIGHLNVGHNVPCVCGLTGCLETISSGAAIVKIYKEKTGIEKSAKEIINSIGNDEIANSVWQDATYYLAIAIVELITILAPELIILGGGVSESGQMLIDALEIKMKPLLTFQRVPRIKLAHFGAQAGSIGTALKALEVI